MGVLQDNLVLSTELIIWIGRRKEIQKLTFRALAIRRSESRNCGLCEVYIQKDGATLLVGAWQREKPGGLYLHQGSTESRKTLEQKFIFLIGTLNPHGINERFSFN